MINYFREGGFGMWLLLGAAIATFAIASSRPREARPTVFVAGVITSLTLGLLGLSTGLVAVSRHFQQFPQPLIALGTGLGELANNGSFAALLAAIQGVAALVTGRAAAKG